MKDFTFHNPVTAVFGDDALAILRSAIEGAKAMVVYGSASAQKNGSLAKVREIASEAEATLIEYGGVSQCTYDAIAEGTALARKEQAQVVIGLGGASAMDTAKAIAFCAAHDDFGRYLMGELAQRNDEKLRLILVPTYPSTGSEANGVSDIMGYAGGIHGVFADYALLYPPFTYSLDERNTAYGTMVMLAQTGYRFFTDANPISRGCTRSTLRAMLGAFDTLVKDPEDYDARGTMLWASFMETSGMLGLGMEGNWTYSIFSAAGLLRFTRGTVYRENLAMVYPRWLVFSARHHPDEVRDFCIEVLGASPESGVREAVEHGYDRSMDILRRGGLPTVLSDIPTFDEVADATHKVSSREFTVKEYYEMIRACGTEAFPGLDDE